MQKSLGLLTGLLLLNLAPAAIAQQASQTDITGVNVWNNVPPLFEIDAPELQALLEEVVAFNAEADTTYTACVDALAETNNKPRRFARPDSPNANLPLPQPCEDLESMRSERDRLQQEVVRLEAQYADPDLLTW